MSHSTISGGKIRRLRARETGLLADHLLRLDRESRRMRFGHAVADAFIAQYAGLTDMVESVVFGYFEGDEMRAAAELRKLGQTWGHEAEAAFSVEKAYQDLGIGTELMGRIIRAARNRGVHELYMSCLTENRKMQRIAAKFEAELRFERGDAIGLIVPDWPSYASLMAESLEDAESYLMAVLDLQRALVRG
ncbi:MAG: GNAT family N-acetyltransferase [Hyphomicrobiaceae bacterium]